VHYTSGEIYWTDTAEDVIQRATPDGKCIESIIVDGLETADGIVVDSTGRKVCQDLYLYVSKHLAQSMLETRKYVILYFLNTYIYITHTNIHTHTHTESNPHIAPLFVHCSGNKNTVQQAISVQRLPQGLSRGGTIIGGSYSMCARVRACNVTILFRTLSLPTANLVQNT
jgi:hypothetical protein